MSQGPDSAGAPTHACRDGGYVVGADDWYPDGEGLAWAHHFLPLGPRIGCTHLVCAECGAPVRSVAGLRWSGATQSTVARGVSDLATLREHAHAMPVSGWRLWACDCALVSTGSPLCAWAPDADESVRPATRWRCAGHPAAALPWQLGAALLTGGIDWSTWVHGIYRGDQRVPLHPKLDALPGFAAHAVYFALADEGERRRLGQAIAACLRADEPALRLGALAFFVLALGSPWDDELLALGPVARVWAERGLAGDAVEAKVYRRWLDAVGWRLAWEAPPGSPAARAIAVLGEEAGRLPGIGALSVKLGMVLKGA